ncbi:MAG: STAS/SEC14 domain-containing protein [Phaeodactylibacter sp.]|nr:STAS/SEC14 domain-containing protein [Phaeodactylibacter sp.]
MKNATDETASYAWSINVLDIGIIEVKVEETCFLTQQEVEKGLDILKEICAHQKYPLLVDLNRLHGIPHATRVFAIQETKHLFEAAAIISNSPIARLLACFFVAFSRSNPYPTRIFTNHKDALDWLKSDL